MEIWQDAEHGILDIDQAILQRQIHGLIFPRHKLEPTYYCTRWRMGYETPDRRAQYFEGKFEISELLDWL